MREDRHRRAGDDRRDTAAVPLNPGVIDTDMLRLAWADGASSSMSIP